MAHKASRHSTRPTLSFASLITAVPAASCFGDLIAHMLCIMQLSQRCRYRASTSFVSQLCGPTLAAVANTGSRLRRGSPIIMEGNEHDSPVALRQRPRPSAQSSPSKTPSNRPPSSYSSPPKTPLVRQPVMLSAKLDWHPAHHLVPLECSSIWVSLVLSMP